MMGENIGSCAGYGIFPPKVLFVTGEYPPMAGGVGAYTHALALALHRQGVAVSVITSRHAQPGPNPQPFPLYPLIDRWGVTGMRTIDRLARQKKMTWVHVQYQTAAFQMNPAIHLAPLWWRRTGEDGHRLRVAWTYHDLRFPYLAPKIGDPLRRWITRLPAQHADWVLTTNPEDQAALAAYAIQADAIPIGSNIFPQLDTPPARQRHRQDRGYQEGDLVLGYFGFLNPSKGGLHLVETLRLLRQKGVPAHLLMIGEKVGASDPANSAYLQQVEQAIAQSDLLPWVQWTGYQSDSDVSADLHLCDLLLLPYEDGASTRRGSLMAALSHGCAVVTTTPHQPIPELKPGHSIIYVAPGDTEAMAAEIQHLFADPLFAQSLRTHAQAASQHFAWPGIATRHGDAYQRWV